MSDVSGALRSEFLCVHTHHTGLRVHWTPGIPRALFSKREELSKQTSRTMWRDCEAVFQAGCLNLNLRTRHGLVVLAKARTHIHRRCLGAKAVGRRAKMRGRGVWSRPSPGRRQRAAWVALTSVIKNWWA